jgi:hypothetical protein
MKKKINLKEKYRKFKAWQKRPREIAPNTEAEHECYNCHDHFKGNYCPRCGQSEKLGKYSLKTAFYNFLDATGMGERGMFRTMRDLVLRPGYLIRDFVNGMQTAYYGPFKMYFLLAAISLLVVHGINIKGENFGDDDQNDTQEPKEETITDKAKAETDTVQYVDHTSADSEKKVAAEEHDDDDFLSEKEYEKVHELPERIFTFFGKFIDKAPNVFLLFVLMIISGGLFQFFKRSPNVPGLRYSEFFVALLYSVNMYSIYSIVLTFFCLPTLASLSMLLVMVPIKQFTGYSWVRTILKFTVASIIAAVLFVIAIILFALFIALLAKVMA